MLLVSSFADFLMNHRPLSPHIQIYRPQLTSVLSITHRMTGIFLCKGVILTVIALGILAYDNLALLDFLQSQPLLSLVKLTIWFIVWSSIYHWLNGLRHLLWDLGYFFDIKSVYRTGWFVMISSLVVTAIFYWAWIQ